MPRGLQANRAAPMPTRPPVFKHSWQPSERQAKAQYERERNVRDVWRSWYRSPAWRQRRAAVLRAAPMCMRCGLEPSTTVHHTTPHRGNAELFWNAPLQALCSSCHSRDAGDK
jgi:5-methylcytosine-specific restriction enzyme A